MTTYTANVTREGRWWVVHVPEINEVTQARRVSEIEKMARELIAVTLDLPLSEVEVSLRVTTVGDIKCVSNRADAIRAEREQALALERQAKEESAQLARELADAHVPVRDIGSILGVSHQRAHQLVSN